MMADFKKVVCIGFVGLVLGASAVENRSESPVYEHILYPGETLRDVARVYACPISVLMTINKISDPGFSNSGTKIFVSAEVFEVSNLAEIRKEDRKREREMKRVSQNRSYISIRHDIAKVSPVDMLIEDLKDDDVRWNADFAVDELCRRFQDDEQVVEALKQALHSKDYQQRQLAGYVLMLPEEVIDLSHHRRLLEVAVEALQDDNMPCDPDGRTYTYTRNYNCDTAMRYLLDHHENAVGLLQMALQSEDWQQRFCAAYILAVKQAEPPEDRSCVIQVLLDHLRSNEIARDARCAVYALYQMGPEIQGAFPELSQINDPQQKKLIELLVRSWTDPQEIDFTGISGHVRNPALFDPSSSYSDFFFTGRYRP